MGPRDRDQSRAEHDARDDYERTYGVGDRHSDDNVWDDHMGIEYDDGSSDNDASDWDDYE